MLTDLHAHSSGISKCCRIPYNEVIQTALQNGIDAIVLTNHYQSSYIGEDGLDGFVERYIDEYCRSVRSFGRVSCHFRSRGNGRALPERSYADIRRGAVVFEKASVDFRLYATGNVRSGQVRKRTSDPSTPVQKRNDGTLHRLFGRRRDKLSSALQKIPFRGALRPCKT